MVVDHRLRLRSDRLFYFGPSVAWQGINPAEEIVVLLTFCQWHSCASREHQHVFGVLISADHAPVLFPLQGRHLDDHLTNFVGVDKFRIHLAPRLEPIFQCHRILRVLCLLLPWGKLGSRNLRGDSLNGGSL